MSQKRFFPRKPSNFTQNIVINTVGDNCCPEDVFISGASFNPSNRTLTLTRNDGQVFTVVIPGGSSTDVFVNRVTFDSNTGVLTLIRNDGVRLTTTLSITPPPSPIVIGNTFFVSTQGDNFTAQPNRLDLPWADPFTAFQAAVNYATANNEYVTVHVFAGRWDYYKNGPGAPNSDWSTPVPQPMVWQFDEKVKLHLTTGAELFFTSFDPGEALTWIGGGGTSRHSITGYGRIWLTEDTYIRTTGEAKAFNIELDLFNGSIRSEQNNSVQEINVVCHDAWIVNSIGPNWPAMTADNYPQSTPTFRVKTKTYEGRCGFWPYGNFYGEFENIQADMQLGTDCFFKFTGDGGTINLKVKSALVNGFAGSLPALEAVFINFDSAIDACALFVDIEVGLYSGNVKPFDMDGQGGSLSGRMKFSNCFVFGYGQGGLYAQPMGIIQTLGGQIFTERLLFIEFNGNVSGYTDGVFNFYNASGVHLKVNMEHRAASDGSTDPAPAGSCTFFVPDTPQPNTSSPAYATIDGKVVTTAQYSLLSPSVLPLEVQFKRLLTNKPAYQVISACGVLEVVPNLY